MRRARCCWTSEPGHSVLIRHQPRCVAPKLWQSFPMLNEMTNEMTSDQERTPTVEDTRKQLDFMSGDRASLEAWLEFYRETIPLKIGGLSKEQLCKQAVPPSSLTLVGLVRHLADVERYWFSNIVGGTEEKAHYKSEDPDADFNDYSEETALADVRHFSAELPRARMHAAKVKDLDTPLPALRHGKEVNLRWVYTHMIEEYARHAGHLDLVRECVDGSTGY